ncbi:14552_t:CDS:2 [Funneliformis geosporum]|uniref:14552_t:CDS:1 n=1 Tax=Funneliformis geosporum TaxID=1117311 RepID=A0A9W4SN92_9GLOM|nr:14552_t:CDS:2 [Funneliformis geosporum]
MGKLANYDGEFESPRIPKEAEVLDDNLPNLGEMARLIGQSSNALTKALENLNREIQGLKQNIQASGGNGGGVQAQIMQLRKIVATTVAAVATGGASLAIQAVAIGAAYLAGSAMDADIKKRENENKQLALAGKAGEVITNQVNGLQNDRSQKVNQLNTLEQQIQQKKSKLNDPNTSESEKAQIRSELISVVEQADKIRNEILDYDKKIEDLLKNIPNGSEKDKITIVMNMDKKLEGPFHTSPGNKCNACGKVIENKEYRRNYNEELYRETGGKEGRITYCLPCGKETIIAENEEENKRIKKNQEERKKGTQETIRNCFAVLDSLFQRLAQENVVGTIEDYKKIKGIQERIKKLDKKTIIDPFTGQACPLIKTDLKNLKKYCQDLINEYISPKDRDTVDNKETESPKFLQSLKSYHIDKLNKKMLNNGISSFELNSLNYQSMLTVPDFLLTQEGIKDTYQKAEKDLEELLKKKGISIPQPNSSSQQSQLLSEIMQLESNPTSSNIQELDSKKQQLKTLETKSKELIKLLPLDTQITILQKEIKLLESKPTKNHLEKVLLTDKKKELAELLSKKNNSTTNNAKPSDKTGLYIGLGAIGILVVFGIFILVRTRTHKRSSSLRTVKLVN